jgi:hypothetical protein
MMAVRGFMGLLSNQPLDCEYPDHARGECKTGDETQRAGVPLATAARLPRLTA